MGVLLKHQLVLDAVIWFQRKLLVKFRFRLDWSIVNRGIVSAFGPFPSDLRQGLGGLGVPVLYLIA